MHVKVEKLLKRTEEVDPVTGNLKYGSSMVSKLKKLEEKFSKIKQLLPHLNSKISSFKNDTKISAPKEMIELPEPKAALEAQEKLAAEANLIRENKKRAEIEAKVLFESRKK
eukprot:CAMPEP_0171460694 /NCGR_PEP_ID=MMETSP0945-20130129/5465_1 /TAXON_ID=109269 /ORGANISM="Vaucheria litorea, Strain CCMP2940" /LENGTH=111 /DNA_ID=CAMNT_0011986943 /DNA_START=130 /DNA_END=462 /DNA_ORIENTATION=+